MESWIQARYNEWKNSEYIEEKDREALQAIENSPEEIIECFYKTLEFGTGGLRGLRGLGTNRMNAYTIRFATQGLANYMLKFSKNPCIAIAYDSRIGSIEYAENTARVMAANGIKAYLFSSLRPTPQLSFAVRHFHALAGVMITASHNPKEYNGYKVYWEDGAQVVAPHDVSIIDEVEKISSLAQVKICSMQEAKEKNLIEMIDESIDQAFQQRVLSEQVMPNIVSKVNDFKMVFTPLCGCGIEGVPQVLRAIGLKELYIVPEQATPDGNFPTLSYPNPEDPKVFKLGIELAESVGARYVLATDPDCDRVGSAVKKANGEWFFPNGNQLGILLTHYILKHREREKTGAVISTIVSTPMLEALCRHHQVTPMRTLTGFKYIGEKIKEFEVSSENYLFGFEESYGYLKGTHARDKDAVGAVMLATEMFAYFESIGSSVEEELNALYETFGYYQEGIVSLNMEGKAGIERIGRIVETIREHSLLLPGYTLAKMRDFKTHREYCVENGKEKVIQLPCSNVLQYEFTEGSVVTIRPSGTEPKLKIYIAVKGESLAQANEKVTWFKEQLEAIALAIL